MKVEIRYVIYENKNGLLLHPLDRYDDTTRLFSWYGYDSMEDAIEAIEKEDHAPDGLLIVPMAMKILNEGE